MLLIYDVFAVDRALFTFNVKNLKMRHLYDKKRLIHHNQTSLEHL